jgi:uncharacterized DUF497 family protein
MEAIRWDERKNRWLKEHRGVCFEQAAVCFASERVLDVTDHPNQDRYPNQKVAVIEIDGYAYLVPYERVRGEIILKTVIPSRKATQRYLGEQT